MREAGNEKQLRTTGHQDFSVQQQRRRMLIACRRQRAVRNHYSSGRIIQFGNRNRSADIAARHEHFAVLQQCCRMFRSRVGERTVREKRRRGIEQKRRA